jgi:DNA primase large subunit
MLEKILRGRLPEQIVALIENLEQNPDTSHLDKILRFADEFDRDITKFERWMLSRTVRKVRKLVKRDELLRKAMEIVINKPETYDANTYKYKASGRYALDTALGTNAMTAQALQESAEKIQRAQMAQQMMNNTWTDPRIALQQRLHDNY